MRPSSFTRSPASSCLRFRSLAGLVADRRAAIAPVVAVFVPVAMGAAGLAIDVSNSYVEQNRLQTAVDEASLVAVRQLPDIEAARAAVIKAFTKQYNGGPRHKDEKDKVTLEPSEIAFGRWDPTTRKVAPTDADGPPPNTVSISVERLAANGQGLDTYFLSAFGIRQLDLRARAVARAEGSDIGTCIIALEPLAGEAIHTQGAARLVAEDCRIQVNSTAGNAIQVTGNAPMGGIEAAEICVAGGAQNSSRMSPTPDTGCATRADPLAGFVPPSFGTCDHHGFQVSGGPPGATTLQPGVYCGGLTIKKSVVMAPGIYVIKDGPFLANGNVQIEADGVALHLVGDGAVIDLTGPVDMNHKAPTTGPLAGFAVYQNPNMPAGLTSRMGQGNSVTRIEGTIYMPDQHLSWGGTPGTTLPPWTLLVARTVYVFGNSGLMVESRFDDSDVPAPGDFTDKKKARLVN